MSLQTLKNQKGFTIVELLIVIVVIGILAAITIVAFNGVQNRGKASAAQSAANTVIKKAEAYNSIESSYPDSVADFAATDESDLAGSGITLAAVTAGTVPSNDATVEYIPCTDDLGAQVSYYDHSASGAARKVSDRIGDSSCTLTTGTGAVLTGTY